jgi:hypothetical protein
MDKALYFGKEVEVLERGVTFSRIQNPNDPSSARGGISSKYLDPWRDMTAKKTGIGFTKARPILTINPKNFARLCEIFRQDPNFSMPISVHPDQEDAVLDEVPSAEDGLSIASRRKLANSYDVVFSNNPVVDALLGGSGGHAGPYFDNPEIRVFNGPRKAFYNALLAAGFKPTYMGG